MIPDRMPPKKHPLPQMPRLCMLWMNDFIISRAAGAFGAMPVRERQ
jgi:hypothetical protein